MNRGKGGESGKEIKRDCLCNCDYERWLELAMILYVTPFAARIMGHDFCIVTHTAVIASGRNNKAETPKEKPPDNNNTAGVERRKIGRKKLQQLWHSLLTVSIKYYLKMILPFIVAVVEGSSNGRGKLSVLLGGMARAQA